MLENLTFIIVLNPSAILDLFWQSVTQRCMSRVAPRFSMPKIAKRSNFHLHYTLQLHLEGELFMEITGSEVLYCFESFSYNRI